MQDLAFKNTTAKHLYNLYINSKKLTAATGAPASIPVKEARKIILKLPIAKELH